MELVEGLTTGDLPNHDARSLPRLSFRITHSLCSFVAAQRACNCRTATAAKTTVYAPVQLSKYLRDVALSHTSKSQLFIRAFAKALEVGVVGTGSVALC